MSLTLKLTSLGVRTLAKPIGNLIKSRARDHERFRKVCIAFAQALHRIDMRMRLGLLQDPAAIERQIAKETRDAEKRRRAAQAPTVKTEAETKADEKRSKEIKHDVEDKVKKEQEHAIERRIRPLSEAKAIDSGANFISETFLFLVAGGLIVFESWRSRRKETSRREDVKERIELLEQEFRKTLDEKNALQKQVHNLEEEVERLTPIISKEKELEQAVHELRARTNDASVQKAQK